MLSRCAGLLTVVALLLVVGGCGQERRTTKPTARMAAPGDTGPNIYLKSYLVGDKRAEIKPDTGTTVGMKLAPNTWFRSNHDVAMYVYHVFEGVEHKFEALLGREESKNSIAEGLVRNTISRLFVSSGWGLTSGDSPVGESGWIRGSANGTSMVVRVIPAANPADVMHVIYNMRESKQDVKVTWNPDYKQSSEFKMVPPKHCIIVRPSTTQLPDPVVTAGEHLTFLGEVRQRAAVAGITLD